MNNRIHIKYVEPSAFEAMNALEEYLAQTGLDNDLINLISVRVSQINGCPYCIDLHTTQARKNGETEKRLYGLNAWRYAKIYTDTERAVLSLAEEMTIISGGISDLVYQKALDILGERALAQAIMAVITVNSWNRIAIATRLLPGD